MPNNIVSYGIVGAVLVVVILFALRKVVGGFLAGFWTTLRDKLPKYGAALGSSLFFVLALFILIFGLVQYGFPEVWKAWYGHPMFWWTLAALVAVGILLNNKKVNASILVVLLLTVTGTWAIQEAELSRTVVVAPIGTRSPPVKLAVGECIRWWAEDRSRREQYLAFVDGEPYTGQQFFTQVEFETLLGPPMRVRFEHRC